MFEFDIDIYQKKIIPAQTENYTLTQDMLFSYQKAAQSKELTEKIIFVEAIERQFREMLAWKYTVNELSESNIAATIASLPPALQESIVALVNAEANTRQLSMVDYLNYKSESAKSPLLKR